MAPVPVIPQLLPAALLAASVFPLRCLPPPWLRCSIEMRLPKASGGRCCCGLSPGTNSKLCCFPFQTTRPSAAPRGQMKAPPPQNEEGAEGLW